MTATAAILPLSLPPRLITRDQAAAFCGLTVRQFSKALRASDDLGDTILPGPISLGGQDLWHVEMLRQRVDALAGLSAKFDDEDEAERRVRKWRQSK